MGNWYNEKKTTEQYAEENRWVFTFDFKKEKEKKRRKKESEDEWPNRERKRVPDHRSGAVKGSICYH